MSALRLGALSSALLWALLLAACNSTPQRAPSRTQEIASSANERAARALHRGDLALARVQYQSALDAAQALQDPALTGAALLNLTLVAARLGELDSAHAYVDRILDAPARFDAPLRARAAARKSLLYLDSAEHDAALHWVDVAAAQCAEPCALAAALDDTRAFVALERGDAAAAAALAGRAVAAAAAAGQASEQASALRLQARAQTQLDATTAAAEALARALQIDRALGQPERVALDLIYAAENEQRRGDRVLARDYLDRALSVYTATGDSRGADAVRQRLAKTR